MLTVVGVVLLARRLAGWSAAVAAGWIAALYPNLWMNDALVMSESLAVLLVVVVVLAGARRRRRHARHGGAAVGVRCGDRARRADAQRAAPARCRSWPSSCWRAAPRGESAVGDRGRADARRHGVALAAVGRAEPRALRAAGAADHQRRHDAARRQLRRQLRRAGVGGWSLFCVLEPSARPPGEDPAVRSDRQRRLAAVRYALDHAERVPIVVAARRRPAGRRRRRRQHGRRRRRRGAATAGRRGPGSSRFWVLAVLAVVGLIAARRAPRAGCCSAVADQRARSRRSSFYGGHRIRAPPSRSSSSPPACARGRRRSCDAGGGARDA